MSERLQHMDITTMCQLSSQTMLPIWSNPFHCQAWRPRFWWVEWRVGWWRLCPYTSWYHRWIGLFTTGSPLLLCTHVATCCTWLPERCGTDEVCHSKGNQLRLSCPQIDHCHWGFTGLHKAWDGKPNTLEQPAENAEIHPPDPIWGPWSC